MASLKKFAGQTVWYGLSSILPRFLNYLLTPYLTRILPVIVYGEMSSLYALIPFLNVVFTYGLETAFFRFSNKEPDKERVYSTASLSMLGSTLLLTALLIGMRGPVASLLQLERHPEFVTWMAGIIALDTLCTLPFARLRNEGRPGRYALIRLVSILTNIAATVFFYSYLPRLSAHPGSFWSGVYDPNIGAGYVLLANLLSSALTLALLLPDFLRLKIRWDGALWRQLMLYALPIMVAGFAGMVNETFDRVMLGWWAPFDEAGRKMEVGIYSACYKLSILITLFIQAFRMGAEPFFFQQATQDDAPKVYARVMKYFVITICSMFLVVMLFLDVWKHFIQNPAMWAGLKVVPVLLLANMCFGVYLNLAIWYKIAHSTRAGAYITILGALLTLAVNYFFIPRYSYAACAWATFCCYAGMMALSYFWGRKVYPVPYPLRRIGVYAGAMLAVYGLFVWASGHLSLLSGVSARLGLATALLLGYMVLVFRLESEDLGRLPFVGRFVRRRG